MVTLDEFRNLNASMVYHEAIAELAKQSRQPVAPQHPRNRFLATVILMTAIQIHLAERLKHLGFSRNSQIKLYGSQFELVGDPLVISEDVVFVDALERKSGQCCRVRIPLNIVRMATEQASQTYAA